MLNQEVDHGCAHALREKFTQVGAEGLSHLDVLIQSPGGDINAAYRCIRFFRRKANTLTFLIPFWTKSAATFMALGADEILMGEEAELGPLDAQVGDGAGSRRPLSALNQFKSLEAIRTFSVETLGILTDFFESAYGMDLPYALDRAQSMTGDFSGALYSQVPPRDLGQYARHLGVAEEYARRVMSRWSYTDRSASEIDSIVRRLVFSYPAHDFNIDLDEARAIGLKAAPMDPELDRLSWELVQRAPLFDLVLPPPSTTESPAPKSTNGRRRSVEPAATGGEGAAEDART